MEITINEDVLARIATYADLPLDELRVIVRNTYVAPTIDVTTWGRGSLIAATIREHERYHEN